MSLSSSANRSGTLANVIRNVELVLAYDLLVVFSVSLFLIYAQVRIMGPFEYIGRTLFPITDIVNKKSESLKLYCKELTLSVAYRVVDVGNRGMNVTPTGGDA
jgi:hypothetical protein